jgi:serine/threonine-protein kinase SRPK3
MMMLDLKLDNILFSNALYSNDEKLEQYLEDHPSEEEDAEPKPQPIPHEWTFETSAYQAERMTVALIDFGHGGPSLFSMKELGTILTIFFPAERAGEEPQAEGFSAPALRAPEIILSSGFGSGLDIWAIGCLVCTQPPRYPNNIDQLNDGDRHSS